MIDILIKHLLINDMTILSFFNSWLQTVKNYWQQIEKTTENPVKVGGKKKQQIRQPRDQKSFKVRLGTGLSICPFYSHSQDFKN